MSVSLELTATGIPQVTAQLEQLPQHVLAAAQDAMEEALQAMADTLADYPPELPHQRYVRTGTLHAGWTDAAPVFQVMGTGLEGVLKNTVEYAPYVEGDGTQADVHQGRWPTVGAVEQAQASAARATIAEAVNAAITYG
jgi:hypothetical protein